MSLELALADAANNSINHNAYTRLILRNGVELTGQIDKRFGRNDESCHLKIGDGWVTVLRSEIIAVHSMTRDEYLRNNAR